MTNLTDLPEEILIIIIKQLDIKSVYNLYRSCGMLKNIILMQGVITKCKLSCNSLATPKSLQLDMIKGISRHLHELNMCGVLNLSKSVLLPAIKRMRCLKTLDVSYTEIGIIDLMDLYRNCSTIKNITIDFPGDVRFFPSILVRDKTFYDCQEVFKNFDNVHFVIKSALFNLPYDVLEKSSLDTLKLTLWEVGCRIHEEVQVTCQFKHLSIFMVGHEFLAYKGTWRQAVPQVKLESIEYIILEYNNKYSVCTSPLFIDFFTNNFNITSFSKFEEYTEMCGVVAILVWDKEKTVFDEVFFSNLKTRIRQILACEIKVESEQTLPLAVDSSHYDWFHIHPSESERNENTDNEPSFKRQRIARSDYILNYDNILSACENIQMRIFFTNSMNATLSSSNNYLRKLTYLSLTGSYVRYSNEFFNVLFRCCVKLITLNVESSSISNCSSFIMRSIPLSQSLKNIRLVDKRIDFTTLFSSFTQCRTLENICIIDMSGESNKLADLGALYQCLNLYSLHINAEMTDRTMTGMINMHKMLCKNRSGHIKFILESSRCMALLDYNPYLNVFNISPVKPV